MTITNGYLTSQEASAYIGRQFPAGDGILDDIVTAASRAIDRHCGRHFYTVTATRVFDADSPYELHLGPYNDLVSVTTLKTDETGDGVYETTISSSDYQLCPVNAANAAPYAMPYTEIELLNSSRSFPLYVPNGREGLVQIVGVWGWPTAVPIEVKQACRLLVHEYSKLQDAPFGMLGTTEFGMSRIPPQKQRHVRELLQPLIHPDHHGIG